jgi:predicted SAM-dependent methyltransferase
MATPEHCRPQAKSLLKLHLGCGKCFIPGFTHIDVADFPHIDYKLDLRDLPTFSDESAELIYCSHALEYFEAAEAPQVLREWYRVLHRGGVLRLAVPDFEALVEVYRRYRDLSLILGPLYGKVGIRGAPQQVIYHKTVYDFSSLERVLENVGFRNVRRYDWRQTIHKDYDDCSQAYIPHMQKETGLLISLNVEADKP